MKNTERNELAVCGFAAVKTLEKNGWEKIRRFYFSKERAPLFGGLCKKLAAAKRPYNQVRDVQELERLCGSVHHQGVVAMIEMPDIPALNTDDTDRWIRNRESAVLLDRVGNANNLGAIVRSAAFFGVRNIVIPWTRRSPRSRRAATGSPRAAWSSSTSTRYDRSASSFPAWRAGWSG